VVWNHSEFVFILEAIMENAVRKPYIKPAIVQELDLEVRAGSALGLPDPFNLTDPSAPAPEGD
jgi:hypothetical protein